MTSSQPKYPLNVPPAPTLRDLVMPVFRHRRLALGVFAAAAILAGVAAWRGSGQYESHMQILVNRERQDSLVSTEAESRTSSTLPPVSEEEINSEAQLLQGRDLLEQVVIANHLQRSHSFWARLRPKQDEADAIASATDRLATQLKVSTIPKTNLIQVGYLSASPRLAHEVLSTLARAYLEKHIAVHRPTGSFDFFAKEADKYRKALDDSEAHLSNFARAGGAAAPGLERTMLSQKIVDSVAGLQQAEQAIAADEQRIRNLVAQLSKTPPRSATLEVSNTADVLLQQLETGLLEAQQKRSQLGLKFAPTYPLVEEADREIAQTQEAIKQAQATRYLNRTTDRDPTYEFLRQDKAKTEADLASHKADASALRNSIGILREQVVDLDQKALQHDDLLREAKANETNYLLYLSKREQERTSDALDQKRIANVAVADGPSLSAFPVHNPALILMAGFCAAALLSIVAAFIAEYFDPGFRTPAEVVEFLSIPLVVGVPRQKSKVSA